MCEENEAKLREREEQYHKHFQEYSMNLQQRQQLHEATVGEQSRLKTNRMNTWEANNTKLYQQLAQQKAQRDELQKQSQRQSCQTWLDMQLKWKDREKQREKITLLQDKEVVEKQAQQLQEEDRIKRLQEVEQRQMYSQALAYQKNLQQLQKYNFGKMTHEEKRINKDDLKNFKDHVPQFNALIPGINNLKSVGAAPFKRTKAMEKPGGLTRMTMSYNDLRAPTRGEAETSTPLDNEANQTINVLQQS